VVFLGAPQERNLVQSIISAMHRRDVVNLAGSSDMITSMAVMRLSSLVISNDTGSAHLGVAASAKVLTIFGPTVPGATAPFGPNAHLIQGVADCAPCRHFRCPKPAYPCMRSISPEAILRKAEEIC
jgi:ADP-heptose:LPS heptosyltransferase